MTEFVDDHLDEESNLDETDFAAVIRGTVPRELDLKHVCMTCGTESTIRICINPLVELSEEERRERARNFWQPFHDVHMRVKNGEKRPELAQEMGITRYRLDQIIHKHQIQGEQWKRCLLCFPPAP